VSVAALPEEWRIVELGTLRAPGDYSLVGGPFGSDLTASDYQTEPGVPVIRGTNLGGNTGLFVDDGFVFVSEGKADSLQRNMAFPGDVVFTQRGTLGQVVVIPDHPRFPRYVISQSQMKLTPDAGQINGRFLFHYFRSPRSLEQISSRALTTGVPHINLGILKAFPVAVPPLAEQRRIAEVLDRAEALRAKRRAALAQFDALSQAIYFDLFGDHRTNSKAIRKAPLGELIKLKSGEFLPATAMVATGKFPVFGGNGINGYHDQFLYEDEKIVIGRVGAYCGCVHVCPPQSWVTDNAMCVSERSADVELGYLAYSLKLANLNQYASQSGQPLVSGSRIYPVEILVPPLALQHEFARRIAAVEKLKAVHRASLAELDALFAALQHRAFQGEL
jgi:type I restriction enzyme S subunit